jgi:hypothetical protein
MPGRSLEAQDQSSFEVVCIRRLVELGLKVVMRLDRSTDRLFLEK